MPDHASAGGAVGGSAAPPLSTLGGRRGGEGPGGAPEVTWKLSLAGLAAVGVAYGFARYGFGLFVPQIQREHGLSLTALGAIASVGYLGYLLALVTVGALVSKVGPRPLILTGTLCATVGLTTVALAPGPVLLAVGIMLAGTSSGWVWAPFSDAVKRMVPDRSRGRVLSVISTGTTFGVIVAAPAALLAGQQTWRQVWLGFAVIALAVTLYNLTVLPPGPYQHHLLSLRHAGAGWFLRRTAVPLYLTALSYGLVGSVFWSFAVALISQTRGSGEATAPLFWGLVGLFGIAGVLTGSLVGRVGLRRAHLLIVVGLAAGIGVLGAAPGWLPAIVGSAMCYGASFMAMAALLAIWSSTVFPDRPATGLSATVFLLALGSLAGPVVAGAVAEHHGIPVSFGLATGVAVLTLLAWPREPGAATGHAAQTRQTAETGQVAGPPDRDGEHKAQFQRDEQGYRYAGRHVLVDLWDAPRIDDPELVRTTIELAVAACGATLLDLRLHQFAPAGITAVALISESHLSFHSWPQENYAAVDIFTCGDLDPLRAVSVLRHQLGPGRINITEHNRGYRHLAVEEI